MASRVNPSESNYQIRRIKFSEPDESNYESRMDLCES